MGPGSPSLGRGEGWREEERAAERKGKVGEEQEKDRQTDRDRRTETQADDKTAGESALKGESQRLFPAESRAPDLTWPKSQRPVPR